MHPTSFPLVKGGRAASSGSLLSLMVEDDDAASRRLALETSVADLRRAQEELSKTSVPRS